VAARTAYHPVTREAAVSRTVVDEEQVHA